MLISRDCCLTVVIGIVVFLTPIVKLVENKAREFRKCEPISIPMCDIYNMTLLPNKFGDISQEEANGKMQEFSPLIKIKCSAHLKLFLCSLYFPLCTVLNSIVLPCRPVCEGAKQGCEPIMKKFGFGWPNIFNCSQFPRAGQLCIDQVLTTTTLRPVVTWKFISSSRSSSRSSSSTSGIISISTNRSSTNNSSTNSSSTNSSSTNSSSTNSSSITSKSTIIKRFENVSVTNRILTTSSILPTIFGNKYKSSEQLFDIEEQWIDVNLSHKISAEWTAKLKEPVTCNCSCRWPLYTVAKISKVHYNRVNVMGLPNCVQPCNYPAFASRFDNNSFTKYWLSICTVLCAVSTFILLVTFSLQPASYRFPELPIIFISLCYFMVSVGYLLRIGLGHEVIACDRVVINNNSNNNMNYLEIYTLRHPGSNPSLCRVVFILIYYFGMAALCWWVMLTLTWFLAAGLKLGFKTISTCRRLYHWFSWCTSGLLTIFALALTKVEGDSVAGVCSVGYSDRNAIVTFVIGPTCILLSAGIVFLLCGLVCFTRHCNCNKHSITKPNGRLETDTAMTPVSAQAVTQSPIVTEIILEPSHPSQKLLVYIGVYAVLYTFPVICRLLCFIYEWINWHWWLQDASCDCYRNSDMSSRITSTKPLYVIIMLKYIVLLLTGAFAGCWVWSRKSLRGWGKTLNRLFKKQKTIN